MIHEQEPTDRAIRILHSIAGFSLCSMMLVVVGDVVLRAVFSIPIKGAYDMVSILLLITVMFGLAPVVAQGREILIDLIDAVMPASGLRVLATVSTVCGIALFAFFGWAMIAPALDAWRWGERSLELNIPKYPLWGITFVGMFGIFWAYLLRLRSIYRSTRAAKDGASK